MATKRVDPAKIQIQIPFIQQSDDYSCGRKNLHSALAYWACSEQDTDRALRYLKTTPEDGTTPQAIEKAARRARLNAKIEVNMTWDRLCYLIDHRRTTIVAIQAHGSQAQYDQVQSGHYVIPVGYDRRTIYLSDPLIVGNLGYLTKSEFMARWDDDDVYKGHLFHRGGIIIWRSRTPYLRIAEHIS